MINWVFLKQLVDNAEKTDFSKKRYYITDKVRIKVKNRDKECKICGKKEKKVGDLHIHHINPKEKSVENNLTILCGNCHQVVHSLLYVVGKYKFVDALRGF